MKNVTVSLDDETFRRGRIRAAEMGKTLSGVCREILNELGSGETEFERLKRQEHELRARLRQEGRGVIAGSRLSRDELYDRAAARREAENPARG